MLHVIRIYIILGFFIYIILCSILYMLGKETLENINEKKIEKLKNTFGLEVQNHIENLKSNKKLSKMDIDYIKSKIYKKNYFEVFNNTVINLNTQKENKEYIKKYILYFETDILNIVKKYKKSDDTKKTFIVNLLGEYGLNNYEINHFLFNCLNTKSIYLRVETLKSLSKIGNIKNFLESLEFISDKGQYVHNKILIDTLDNFNGDIEVLDKNLLSKFYIFNKQIQKCIIEHFKNINAEFAKDKIIEILKDENLDKEVRISSIKYFSKIHYNNAKLEIKKLLNHKEWEYRAISASTLGKYKEEDVIEELSYSITDHNWYVRYNSALSLLNFNDVSAMKKVIDKNDKYSRDILLYAMLNQEIISYEYYLEKTGKSEVNSAC